MKRTITELKEVTDALRIEKDKLLIFYERPLGTGASSMVYRGILSGVSPLAKMTNNTMDTQQFRDCEVAAKLALQFGNDEVEQLLKEIEVMRIVQYHTNVISMLGWVMLNNKPGLVFEIAEQDLLTYVETLRTKDEQDIPFSNVQRVSQYSFRI